MSLVEVLNKVFNIQVEKQPSANNEAVAQETAPLNFSDSAQDVKTNAYELSNDDSDCLNALNEAKEVDCEQYVIDELEEELIKTKENFKVQDDKDGVVNEVWNGVKEIFNFGISKSDVASAIEKQEDIVDKLKQAKIDGNFSEVYEEITGNKYDKEKLIECHNTEVALNTIQSDLDNILKSSDNDEIKQQKVDEYLANFQNNTGISYEQLTSHYKEMSNQYLAGTNELTNVLNSYADSQENFIDKTAQSAQILGVAGMIVGGVACFLPVPGARAVGMGIMKAGQMLSLGGMFGDNALEAVDLATNKQSVEEDKDEYKELAKETIVDEVLYLSGRKAGDVGNAMGAKALERFGNKAIAKVAEIGADATLSLASDALITGEVDLKGEGFSQALGILTGLAGSKIQNMKTDVPDVKVETLKGDVEVPKGEVKDVDFNTRQEDVVKNSPWVVQGLDNTCASASLINAIIDKPELYYELNHRIFLQEDGTYNVVLGGEVLPYHSDSDLPESTAKIVYGAWVKKYGEECDGDFVTQVFSILFEYNSHKILLKPTTENLAELDFYNNGQHTVLTANKDGHSYTFDGVSKNGTMLLRDPQNPDSVLEIEPDDFNDWQIVGESFTKPTLIDGSVENKVRGVNWEEGQDEFLDTLANELSEEDFEYDDFLEYYGFDKKIAEDIKINFYRYYKTQPAIFEDFCKNKSIKIDKSGKVSLADFMCKVSDNPAIIQEFVERSVNEVGFRGRNNGIKAPKEADKQHVIAKNSSGNWEFDINTRGELTGTHTDEAIDYLFSLSIGACVPGLNGRNGAITYKSPSGDEIRIGRGSTTTIIKKSTTNGKTTYKRGYCLNGGSLSSVRYGAMSHSPEQACNEIIDNLDKIKYIKTAQDSKYFITKDTNDTVHFWEFKGDNKKINTLFEVQGLGKGIKNKCANIDGYAPFVHSFSW